MLREPGGQYLTHVTPTSGRGVDIAAEIVSVVSKSIYILYWLIYKYTQVRENGGKCTVLGCDGTSVNTGIHTGSYSLILQKPKT